MSYINRVVGLWKEKLAATNQKAAQSLADPAEYENLFPGLQEAVRAEQLLKTERSRLLPASAFPSVTVSYATHHSKGSGLFKGGCGEPANFGGPMNAS